MNISYLIFGSFLGNIIIIRSSILKILILSILCFCVIRSQNKEFPLNNLTDKNYLNGTWTELNPNIPRVDYYGLDFINPDTGWACGYNTIIKTTNGGLDWTVSTINIESNINVNKISSFNGKVVIAVGDSGKIVRSEDHGENFEIIASGSKSNLWAIQMVSDSIGWVISSDSTLLKSTDSGITWGKINTGFNQRFYAMEFLNEYFGVIVTASGNVLKTTNGGGSWSILQNLNMQLNTIDIIDTLHIAVAGWEGTNAYSSDGGNNWIINQPLNTDLNSILWIEFIDRDTGYMVDFINKLSKTTNRGETWTDVNVGYQVGPDTQIEFFEDGTGYASGTGLSIYKRTNGLDNWESLFWNSDMNQVFFVNDSVGFISSDGLYKTTSAGLSWDRIHNDSLINNIFFIDSLIGFYAHNKLYKTVDGGNSWYIVADSIHWWSEIIFLDADTAWTFSYNKILKTTNRGESWFLQSIIPGKFPFSTPIIKSMHLIDYENAWIITSEPWQTTDGGLTWINRNEIPIEHFSDIFFKDKKTGWISADNSFPSIYKTTDEGINWVPLLDYEINRSKFFPINGTDFVILYGYDKNGNDKHYLINLNKDDLIWENISNQFPLNISSFHSASGKKIYAVGPRGLIMRFDDTTKTSVPVEPPLSFELTQNYPNPFNTGTVIRFSIFISSDMEEIPVTLKVYDILGNEIETLVKADYRPGNYEVTFDPNNLSSGIYFYRLQSLDKTLVKKMVLLR